MEEKLAGSVAFPEWELCCWPPPEVWCTGGWLSSFCPFFCLKLAYLVHNMSNLPPGLALTMTGATFSHLESLSFFLYHSSFCRIEANCAGRSEIFHQTSWHGWHGEQKTFRHADLLQSRTAQGSAHVSWPISSPQYHWVCPYYLQFM